MREGERGVASRSSEEAGARTLYVRAWTCHHMCAVCDRRRHATRSVSPAVQFTRCVAVRTVLRKVSGRGTRLESRWVPAIFFVSRAGGPRAVGPRRVYAIGYTAPDRRYHYGHGPHTVYLYRKGRPGYPPEPPARATTVRYRPGVLYFLPYSDRCQSVKADWLQTDPYVCHGGGGGDR